MILLCLSIGVVGCQSKEAKETPKEPKKVEESAEDKEKAEAEQKAKEEAERKAKEDAMKKDVMEQIKGIEYMYYEPGMTARGSMRLTFDENGKFEGVTHMNSDKWSPEEERSLFHGVISDLEKVSDHVFSFKIANLDYEKEPERVQEGETIYVAVPPTYIENGNQVLMYLAGCDLKNLDESVTEADNYHLLEKKIEGREALNETVLYVPEKHHLIFIGEIIFEH